MNFFDFLTQRVNTANSLLCVGLDPRTATVHEAYAECVRLIDATHEFAAIYKPNSAFFEVFGPDGMHALQEVIAHVPRDIPVLLDAKRGDIGDTSVAYAKAAFDVYKAHAMTVSPYLGRDAVEPFIARADHGAFILCKTSNPGSDDFQKLTLDAHGTSRWLAEHVAATVQTWNEKNNVGLVVGATDPAAMRRVRAAAPDLWYLVPGIGAQGGDLEATLQAGLRPDGMGLLISTSRSLARAKNPAADAHQLRDAINLVRDTVRDTVCNQVSTQQPAAS